MKVFTVTEHGGVLLGGCSVIVAEDEAAARILLDDQLFALGLRTSRTHKYVLRELLTTTPVVRMLRDGAS